jgi:hypothetical protein
MYGDGRSILLSHMRYRIGVVSSISFGLGKWFESVGEVCPWATCCCMDCGVEWVGIEVGIVFQRAGHCMWLLSCCL